MRATLLISISLLLSSCAVREVGTFYNNAVYQTSQDERAKKIIFITIDGTSNTLTSRTNAGRFFEMVDAFAPLRQDRKIATWYAEGVGSGDAKLLGLSVGAGMGQDIKNAYSFLTRVWQPGDEVYLSGFSRGAYGVRALGGLLYSAGIPDLSQWSDKERTKIVDELFDAYKVRCKGIECKKGIGAQIHAKQRDDRIGKVQAKIARIDGSILNPRRHSGYRNPQTTVSVEAIIIWDTVAALGRPDGSESPLEGPDHYLLTSCNVRYIFHALSLDDNRVYSFTPIFADGPKMLEPCKGSNVRQNVHLQTEEVWFSGAHSDVGGTYENGGMIDGSLPNVSLNWVLSEIQNKRFGLLPFGLGAVEDRLSIVHDAERDGLQNKILHRQSRKPSVYSHHAYREDNSKPSTPDQLKIHASVFDRLYWLFALDGGDKRCSENRISDGKPLLCAKQIASYGLVPELIKANCLMPTKWGYGLVANYQRNPACPIVIGSRTTPESAPATIPDCLASDESFIGKVYGGKLYNTNLRNLKMVDQIIPPPNCLAKPKPTG